MYPAGCFTSHCCSILTPLSLSAPAIFLRILPTTSHSSPHPPLPTTSLPPPSAQHAMSTAPRSSTPATPSTSNGPSNHDASSTHSHNPSSTQPHPHNSSSSATHPLTHPTHPTHPALTPLERDILEEYALLLENLNKLSPLLAGLSATPTAGILDGLGLLERKTSLVSTLLKASVYSIVLQQEMLEGEG